MRNDLYVSDSSVCYLFISNMCINTYMSLYGSMHKFKHISFCICVMCERFHSVIFSFTHFCPFHESTHLVPVVPKNRWIQMLKCAHLNACRWINHIWTNLFLLIYMIEQDLAEILGYVQKVLISVISLSKFLLICFTVCYL